MGLKETIEKFEMIMKDPDLRAEILSELVGLGHRIKILLRRNKIKTILNTEEEYVNIQGDI